MSEGIAAALIAAPFTVIVAVITAWATLKVHSIRRERRVNLILPRLGVYKTLWSLMDEVTRDLRSTYTEASEPEPLGEGECETVAVALHNWYFCDGNGIFLSPKARDQFCGTKDKLIKPQPSGSITLETLLEEFSDLRYLMRKDIGAYEDLSVYERFGNVFLEQELKGSKSEKIAGEPIGPIGRRPRGSVATATSQQRAPEAEASGKDKGERVQSSGQRNEKSLGARAAEDRRQREAENRSGQKEPPAY